MAVFSKDQNFPQTTTPGPISYRSGRYLFVVAPDLADGIVRIDLITNAIKPINLQWVNPSYHFINDFVVLKGVIYAVGNFDTPVVRQFCAWDMNGNLLPWDFFANSSVVSIETDGTDLYISGQFTFINGIPRRLIAKVTTSGDIVDTWNADITSGGATVNTIKVIGSQIYMGSTTPMFFGPGSTPRNRVASVDISTGALSSFDPNISGGLVFEFVDYGTDIFMVGSFTTVSGNLRPTVARVTKSTGALVPSFNPLMYSASGFSGTVFENKLFVGGSFPEKLLILDTETGTPTGDSLDASFILFINVNYLNNDGLKLYLTSYSGDPNDSPYFLAAFFLKDPLPDPPIGTPRTPIISWLLRKDGQTLLKWQPVVFDVYHNRIEVSGYRIYRSNNENLETFEPIAEVTTLDVVNNVDTMFSEYIQGFYAYGVTAFTETGESEMAIAKQVNSVMDSDLL